MTATPAGRALVDDGRVYDRASMTWVTPDEMAAREAERDERRFLRRARQGEFPTPHIMGDFRHGDPGVTTDGVLIDSRRAKREYMERKGLIEYEDVAAARKSSEWVREREYRDRIKQDIAASLERDAAEIAPREKVWEQAGLRAGEAAPQAVNDAGDTNGYHDSAQASLTPVGSD